MLKARRLFSLLFVCLLTACVSLPTGPSIMTLPGSGKSFDQFRQDDYECREYAYQQIGGKTPQQSSRTSGVESAAIGAGLGAVSGVAMAGGEGAAVGAGVGLLVGALMGLSSGTSSGYENQQRYDIGYIQCMYAKGHRVPVSADISRNQPINSGVNPSIPTPPASFTPPPPPGNPPPPPQ